MAFILRVISGIIRRPTIVPAVPVPPAASLLDSADIQIQDSNNVDMLDSNG